MKVEQPRARVTAIPGVYVWDDAAGLAGIRRYVAWEMDGVRPAVPLVDIDVERTPALRRALRKGDLRAADEMTAIWAGVLKRFLAERTNPERSNKPPRSGSMKEQHA